MSFPIEDELLATRLKAVAHPARLQILELLANRGECVCGEVVEVLPLSQATVSQHLKILKEADLLIGTIDGQRSCYCLNEDALATFRQTLNRRLVGLDRSERSQGG